MSSNSSWVSHFWKELKRRKVLRSLAIYAGTAFIILGAFITFIVAWIFDISGRLTQKSGKQPPTSAWWSLQGLSFLTLFP